jgi:hypothetical protein
MSGALFTCLVFLGYFRGHGRIESPERQLYLEWDTKISLGLYPREFDPRVPGFRGCWRANINSSGAGLGLNGFLLAGPGARAGRSTFRTPALTGQTDRRTGRIGETAMPSAATYRARPACATPQTHPTRPWPGINPLLRH